MNWRVILANQATAARRRVYFHLVDATDGITAETGEAGGQPEISTNGAAFTSAGSVIGVLVAIGTGRYYAELSQAAVATADDLIQTRYKSAATAECPGDSLQVVAYDPGSTSLGLLLAAANLSADTITAAKVAADVTTEIQAGLATSAALTTAQADLDDIQTRIPAALVGGRMDSSVGAMATGSIVAATFAAGAIDNAAIATDAIGSAELAATAVNEIADQVWDEVLSGHLTAGTTGAALNTAGSGASASVIADAVWDELRSGHVGAGSFGERVLADATLISGDSAAADALETMLDGTGGNVLTLSQLRINSTAAGGAVDIDNTSGPAISARTSSGVASESVSTGGNGAGIVATGQGSGRGMLITAGASGAGLQILGGSTSGNAITATCPGSSGTGLEFAGAGAGNGASITGGASGGNGLICIGSGGGNGIVGDGGTTGNGIKALSDSADAFVAEATTIGHGISAIGVGANAAGIRAASDTVGHGISASGGSVSGDGIHTIAIGIGDGIEAVGAGGGFDINADIQGSLSGSVGSVTGNVGGNVVGSVGSVAANGITATSLDPSASSEIADQVWDEVLSGHLTAGTTGAALNAAGSGASAATIADAVWDEARAGHVAAGSFGEGVSSVQGNVTGSVASVTGNVGGNVTGSVGSIAAGGLTATSTDATFVTEVQGAADAALVARRLDELIDQVASPATPTINSFLDRITSKDGSQTYDRSTDSLEAVRDALAAAGPSAATIADAVWDEARSGHVAAGSFGEGVASVQGNVTGSVASVTGNVTGSVGSVAAGGITAASIATGAVDADALATDAVTEITNAVDAAITASHGVGSYVDTGAAPTAAVVADAVWDEARAGHVGAGSFGEGVASVQGNVTGSTASVTGNVGGNVVGTVASVVGNVGGNVTGSVASVLGNVAGNVVGSVGSVAAGGITAASIATGAIDADSIAADAGTEIAAAVDVTLTAAHGAGAWGGGGGAPTVAQIADGVWDEILAGHAIAGSTGEALSNAAAGGAGLTAQQVANALNLAPVGVAAAGSVNGNLDEVMGPGFNPATDSLEEIRDEVDACCGTGGGADVVDVEGI